MQNENELFTPVLMYDNGHITNYYGSFFATVKDGYDPYSVLQVCRGKQKTHKKKKFCFIQDFGIIGENIQNRINQIREEV